MKHYIYLFSFILGITLITPLIAEEEGKPSVKLGVLDWQRLVSTAPQAKEAGKRLESEFQAPSQKLNDKQNDYQKKRTQLQRDKEVLSVVERAKKEKELAKLEQEIRHLDEELRAETTTRNREEMDVFLQVVRDVVEKFGRENAYDAIFSQEVMAYYSDRVDITDQILERLQKLPKSNDKK